MTSPESSTHLLEAVGLLDDYLDLAADQRRRRLDELRRTDPLLAVTIERLLAADASQDVRLDAAPALVPLPLDDAEAAERMLGRQLGVWRLAGLIGRGGMGLVYRAERSDGQFEQECAIKLIAMGLVSGAARRRFLRERQILARLRHDNIAALIDGGITDMGEPWYAMELVDGVPIDQWCDRHRLGLRERVQLFQQVLDAVRYAHSQLVVHRDLKPSNVLVSTDGRVKLLDFGVAKLVESGPEPSAGQTIDLALTPAYAAPEQIVGKAAGPATDIYTLGVMLYGLLAGIGPHGEDAGATALLRHRLSRGDQDVAPMSQAAAQAPAGSAELRRLRPATLRRALRGGLGAIVQRCLHHDPDRRYLTVDELSDDLGRWMQHRPVLAYRGQWRYRARQFLRRNRTPLFIAALIVTGVVAFIGYRGVQLAQTRYERDLYTQTFNFVTDVIARATASERGADLTVREALDLMMSEMDRRELPVDVRVWLIGMIADIHAGARDLDTAVKVAGEGLQQTGDVDNLVQARLHEGQALAMEMGGRHDQAIEHLDQALVLVEQAPVDENQVSALSRLLTTKVRFGIRQGLVSLDEAQALAERAIALGRRTRGQPATSVEDRAQARAALIDVHIMARDYAAAEQTLAQQEAQLEQAGLLGGHLLLDTLVAGHHLALGHTGQALADYERLIESWTGRYGPDFRTVGSLYAQYAHALERLGRIEEAIAASREARRIARQGDTGSMDVLGLDRLLARRLLRAGQVDEADQVATALIDELAGREHADARAVLAQTWLVRADVALMRDDAVTADAHMAQARTVLDELPPDDTGYRPTLRAWQRVAAEACLLRGDPACAETHARAALAEASNVLEDPHELLLLRRALVLALAAQPDHSAEVAALRGRFGDEAVAFGGDCNPFALVIGRPEPLSGMAALAAVGESRCPASPETAGR